MRLSSNVLPDNFLRCMSRDDRKKLGKAGMTREEVIREQNVRRESELKKLVIEYIRLHDVHWIHDTRSDRPHTGPVGTPDLLFAYRAIPCAIELKYGKGTSSDAQKGAIDQMMRDGWETLVARNLDDVMAFLKILDERIDASS